MIKIIVATPKGELMNKDVDSIVVSGDTGELGILTNRLPVLTKISKGFVKVNDTETQFVGIVNGVLDFKDNIATVIAQTAAVSDSVESAFNIIKENNELIIKANKQNNVDFVKAEKDLIDQIKESKAGHIN